MSMRCFSPLIIIVVVSCMGFGVVRAAEPGDLLFEFQKPNHAGGDLFGRSMASFGNNVLISAPYDDTVGFGAGAVYMYNTSGQLLQTFYNPTPYSGSAGSEYFGRGLASLGNSVLIGDPYDSSVVANGGAVYMFDSVTGALQQTFLNPSGAGSPGSVLEEIEYFGECIAGVGTDKVLVGAWGGADSPSGSTKAYLFDAATGGLLHTFTCPTPQAYSRFGYSVLSVGGKIAISQTNYSVGTATADQRHGAVHIYDAETYQYLYTLYDPTPIVTGQFGYSLAAFGDDLLVGGYGACLFDLDTGELVFDLYEPGMSQSMVARAGDDILVGAPYASQTATNVGAAYLFDGETGELLATIANPTPDSFEYFGVSVAGVGDYAAVASEYDDTYGFKSGAAYLFKGTSSPEPASLALLLMGGGFLLRKRSFKRCSQ